MNLLSIVALCFCGALACLLLALVWALSHIRAHVPWPGSTKTQQPPVYVGVPTQWRRKNPSERWTS